jgi:hypothetical protein
MFFDQFLIHEGPTYRTAKGKLLLGLLIASEDYVGGGGGGGALKSLPISLLIPVKRSLVHVLQETSRLQTCRNQEDSPDPRR